MAGAEAFCCFIINGDVASGFRIARWVYTVAFLLVAVVTWLLRDYADEIFASRRDLFSYCLDPSLAALCAGTSATVRFCFANFVYFAAHAVALAGLKSETDPRVGLHTSGWVWKLVVWAGTIVGFFFVPTPAVLGFAQAARIGAGLFLVFQIINLLDVVYAVNEWLLAKGARWANALLVLGSAAGFGAAIAAISVAFHFYAQPGCRLNIFFCAFTVVALVASVAVLCVPKRAPSSGLLTSGAVLAYTSYLLLSALNSEPLPSECVRGVGTSEQWLKIVGFVIVLAVVAHSTGGTGTSDVLGGLGTHDGALPYRADFFHAVFALASMYLAMLFSSWSVSPSAARFQLDEGWVSTWVKMASKWGCEALYLWTVVAPALLRHRDFDYFSA